MDSYYSACAYLLQGWCVRVHIAGQLLQRGNRVADGKVHRERTNSAFIFNQFKVKVESQ